MAVARQLRGVDWLGLAASDVITSCCRCKGAAAWEALFAACYTLPHRGLVVLDNGATRGVGDSGKGADLLNLGDLSKITVHSFGAQGCVLFPFNCEHLLLRWREHVLFLE